ncbi:hypothetical protein F53441_14339, partial [Fusarium austroafricanum]
ATSTLVLPDVPKGRIGVASLWVSTGTDKGDLIQSIADNWVSNEWNIFAYTLTKTDKYDDSTPEYVGHKAMGSGSSVECGAEDCGTIGAQKWVDTKITLDLADPGYINTFGKGEGVTGDLTTEHGGKTWVGAEFDISEHTF